MRCQRCNFENIPSQKTCIKCGSVLEIKPIAINVHPPRMPKWKRPFRNLLRLVHKGRVIPEEKIALHYPPWLRNVFSDSFWALFLSIIPGLAHFLQDRFKEIRWYFLAWLILLTSGLFLYGSTAGFICLGLTVGVHAGIAVQYGIIKDLANLREKIFTVVLVLLTLTFIYRFTPRTLIPNLTGGYSSITIPYQKVEAGDYLLAWRHRSKSPTLPRGSIVLFHPVTVRVGAYRGVSRGGKNTAIGQVIGFDGEVVQIKNGIFIVNGQELDSESFPVPGWLRNREFSTTIGDKSYFLSSEYGISGHGIENVLEASYVSQVCLVKVSDIEAKVFMRWWPLLKRGFIR